MENFINEALKFSKCDIYLSKKKEEKVFIGLLNDIVE